MRNPIGVRLAVLLVGGVGLAMGLAAATDIATKPAAAQLGILESPLPSANPRFRVIPRVVRPKAAFASLLDERLAAVAEELEAQQSEGLEVYRPALRAEVLGREVESLVHSMRRRATVGVFVRDLVHGRDVVDISGRTLVNPASNQKILTAAAALDFLGGEYTFETGVSRAGRELYLIGQGDPTLDHDDLYALATLTAEAVELAEIERLVVDDTSFSANRFGPGFDPGGVGWSYEAPSGALSMDFNTVEITVSPVVGQRRLQVQVDPASGHIEIRNKASVGRRRALAVSTKAEAGKTVVEVRGTLRRRNRPVTVRRRVTDPGMFVGLTFARMLSEVSSSAPLPVARGSVPPHADAVVFNDSAPLVDILELGLAYSNNFVAEQVLRTSAWRMTGEPGDWDAGREILERYWEVLGADPEQLVVRNGSGLSAQGRVSAAGLVEVLTSAAARRASGIAPGLIDVLPVAGEPGTLRTRLRRSQRRVRAKTGTLRNTSGLSGVVTSNEGEPQVAFSIVTNVRPGESVSARRRRRLEDRIVLRILAELDRSG